MKIGERINAPLFRFEHINALTVDEAVSSLGEGSKVLAGGTDLLGIMNGRALPVYPEVLVNIKTISGMDYINEDGEGLKIGALAKLDAIANDSTVKAKYGVLAEAARKVAAWQHRKMGTIGGNICQDIRCVYYRAYENYYDCLRKNPNGICYALVGDNRYHSIFGGVNGCIAVHASDTAPALVALDAKVKTSKRTINIEDFFEADLMRTTVLDDDEIVTEIQVPTPAAGTKSAFIKVTIRKAIDFAIVNCAAAISSSDARICLSAVHNNPYRATAAEDSIRGKAIDESSAEAAGDAAVSGATSLPLNKYKIHIAKTLVKRAILACK